MDIAGLSVVLSQNAILSQVGTAMLDKIMESSEVFSQELASMMDAAALERSVSPHIGSNVDILL